MNPQRQCLLLISMLLISGCQSTPPPPVPEAPPSEQFTRKQDNFSLADSAELPLGGWVTASDLWIVYFSYDSAALDSTELNTLNHNAGVLLADDGLVQIAGHCDERGTQEYNLALGEKRALAVREYLIRRGVDPKRLFTISYGEEQPAAVGNTEEAYAQTRRVEFRRQAQ